MSPAQTTLAGVIATSHQTGEKRVTVVARTLSFLQESWKRRPQQLPDPRLDAALSGQTRAESSGWYRAPSYPGLSAPSRSHSSNRGV